MFEQIKKHKNLILIALILIIFTATILVVGGFFDDNARDTAANIKGDALDVVELKAGKDIICKIVGQTPKNYFIKNLNGVEEEIDRSSVKNIRKASNEEMESNKVILARLTYRFTSAWKRFNYRVRALFGGEKAAIDDNIEADIRYKKEVAAAKKAKQELEQKLAGEEAKKENEEEGGHEESGHHH